MMHTIFGYINNHINTYSSLRICGFCFKVASTAWTAKDAPYGPLKVPNRKLHNLQNCTALNRTAV